MNDFDFEEIADQYDNMEFAEQDVLVNIADTAAVKLALQTKKKIEKVVLNSKSAKIAQE